MAALAGQPMDLYPLSELQDSIEPANGSSISRDYIGCLRFTCGDSIHVIHVHAVGLANRDCPGCSRGCLALRCPYSSARRSREMEGIARIRYY